MESPVGQGDADGSRSRVRNVVHTRLSIGISGLAGSSTDTKNTRDEVLKRMLKMKSKLHVAGKSWGGAGAGARMRAGNFGFDAFSSREPVLLRSKTL
jgi:hypothetical protein